MITQLLVVSIFLVTVTSGQITRGTSFLSQKLDHYNKNDNRTFAQKFDYTFERFNGKAAFLLVSDFDTSFRKEITVYNSEDPIIELAEKHGAAVFRLQHRLLPDRLEYQSPNQAVEDVASFILFAREKFKLGDDVKWIVFGCGYAGNIASWARANHSEVVAGAIASSAPLDSKIHFWDYLDQVATTIKTVASIECAQKIKELFTTIRINLHTEEGRRKLAESLFHREHLFEDNSKITRYDVYLFVTTITEPFKFAVQKHTEANMAIQSMCSLFNNENDILEQLRDILTQEHFYFPVTGHISSGVANYSQYIQYLKTSYAQAVEDSYFSEEDQNNIDRVTMWQKCNYFGWFHSLLGDETDIFGSEVPLRLWFQICKDAFDIEYMNWSLRDRIDNFQHITGGAEKYTGTNVVFTSGQLDPISRLSKTNSLHDSVVIYQIKEGFHAEDLLSKKANNRWVIEARAIINTNIYKWIHEPVNPVTKIEIPSTVGVLSPYQTRKISQNQEVPENKFVKVEKKLVPQKKNMKKEHIGIKMFHGKYSDEYSFADEPSDQEKDHVVENVSVETGYFKQHVDHFDNQNSDTYLQRFYKVDQFATEDGPNILVIGGEWSLTGRVNILKDHNAFEIAKNLGATFYYLEHRYYGKSFVNENSDKKYLSALQALYDISHFIKTKNDVRGRKQQWFTYGCSYAGMLSAWARELFPEDVYGSVACSAPIRAKFDFYEYELSDENSIALLDPECATNYQRVSDELFLKSLTKEGINQILNRPSNEAIDENALNSMNEKIYETTDLINVQEYDAEYFRKNCDHLKNATSFEDMSSIRRKSFDTDLEGNEEHDSDRDPLWYYQTCNEFAFYQSFVKYSNFFNFEGQSCLEFGPNNSPKFIEDAVKATNRFYGSTDNFQATNVIFVNSKIDPWHTLSKLTSNEPSVLTLIVETEKTHCPAYYTEKNKTKYPQVTAVQETIAKEMEKWTMEWRQEKSGKMRKPNNGQRFSLLFTVVYSVLFISFAFYI